MFTVRRILSIGLLAFSATGCAVAPGGPHVVHEVYHPYPSTQLYIFQHRHYGYSPRHHDDVDRRQHVQQRAIKRGYRSGRLTRDEARSLKAEQHDIARQERRYEKDGRLSRRERSELRRDLDRSARHIRSEIRDGDRRGRR